MDIFNDEYDGYEREYQDPYDYLDLSDDELRKLSSRARNEKIKGIRRWPSPLSPKQRYCLAVWISDNENKFS